MRGKFGTVVLGIAILPFVTSAQDASTGHLRNAASEEQYKFVRNGWAQDENMLSKAVSLRARKLEEKTNFRFDRNWTPKVSLEWSLGSGVDASNGIYQAETQTIYFPIRILYELRSRHTRPKDPLSAFLNERTAADDSELGELLDHELGHELMDQVSRRNGLGPWFTEERFGASTYAEKLGLDILSEGTAQFFQRVDSPRDDSDLSELTFPATTKQQNYYTYRMIAYDGGYWIVRDVLSKHGERGLLWLMRHPFVPANDMRTAALGYRDRALKELSEK